MSSADAPEPEPQPETTLSAPLRSATRPQPLGSYLRELWERRQFTMSLATGSLKAEHLDTALGGAWHVLNPSLSMVVYYLIFGLLLGTDRGVDNFIGFLGVGIFTFSFAQRTTAACGASLTANIGLIRSLQFPRAVLPVSTVIRELYGYSFSAVVMVGVLLLTGERPNARWLLSLVVVLLLTIFSAGIGLIVARLTEQVRDVANIIPFIFRLLFYLSGIIFQLEAFLNRGAVERIGKLGLGLSAEQLRHAFVLNPYFTYIDLLRDSLLSGHRAEFLMDEWIVAVACALVTFVVGLLYFRGGERSYGRG